MHNFPSRNHQTGARQWLDESPSTATAQQTTPHAFESSRENDLARHVELSVIVPVYNESATLSDSVGALLALERNLQIIIVDDGSTDGSAEIARTLARRHGIHVIHRARNAGKGMAIRAALSHATGDYVAIHDADLEYDPRDLVALLDRAIRCDADAVFGIRFHRSSHSGTPAWHRWVNQGLTSLFNLVTGTCLSDVETCYKLARRHVFSQIAPSLAEQRFGIEIELTARLAAMGVRIVELPICYESRSYSSGKKIGWRDGISALRCIIQYGATARLSRWQVKEIGA